MPQFGVLCTACNHQAVERLRKIALKNHNLRSWKIFRWFPWWRFESKSRAGTLSNEWLKMAKKPRVRRWRRGRYCRMVPGIKNSRHWTWILPGGIMFTTADCGRNDSGWSWKFRIVHVNLHDYEVAPGIGSFKVRRQVVFSIFQNS